jgi:two-component system response regulator AtoC
MAQILVVDNEERMCKVIQLALEEKDHAVDSTYSGAEALQKLDTVIYDIVITDLKMKEIDGLAVLRFARQLNPAPEVILITAYATQQTAIEAMRAGAFDYLIKPFEMDDLLIRVERILKQKDIVNENIRLKKESRVLHIPNIVGKSEKMRHVYGLIDRVSPNDTTVIILGESGTGKELVAEAIHENSPRKKHRFIAVNCAAVPENLLESELFGYEKGAFTGAFQRKLGYFELANQGTIFLDEIGDVSLGLQTKLLRVLQNKEIIRIGGSEKIKIDARVITATNKNLEKMVEQGTFRSDLYYRINVFPIDLPSLRERKEDIPELVETFLQRIGHINMTSEAKIRLMSYHWPGNIRELLNVIERAAIIADHTIDVNHLPGLNEKTQSSSHDFTFPENGLNLDALEQQLITEALARTNGNKTRAAQLLGITRRRLYSMMERLQKMGNQTAS